MHRQFALLLAAMLVSMPTPSPADEAQIKLKAAPGSELVETNCVACHSLDYIKMNAKFMSQATWDAEMQKMTKRFGAPVSAEDAKAILDYLVKNYGA